MSRANSTSVSFTDIDGIIINDTKEIKRMYAIEPVSDEQHVTNIKTTVGCGCSDPNATFSKKWKKSELISVLFPDGNVTNITRLHSMEKARRKWVEKSISRSISAQQSSLVPLRQRRLCSNGNEKFLYISTHDQRIAAPDGHKNRKCSKIKIYSIHTWMDFLVAVLHLVRNECSRQSEWRSEKNDDGKKIKKSTYVFH